ncbi:MAG: peptidylprolyl isomerase [Deltaproteobacteria bacterium]|nr:peptidylprolyl isomerase [Deltaproteobacteria bacterium]
MKVSRLVMVVAAVVLAAAGGFGCRKQAPAADAAVAPADVAAQQAAPAARVTGPVAKVNGVDLDSKDFYAELDKITQGGARNIPEDRLAKIRENVLNRQIEEELIRQEVKKQGIEVSETDLAAEFDKYKARFKTDEQFQNYLTHGKTSIDEIKARLRDSLALNRLLTKLGKLDVTDEDVRKAYETGIKMYTEPEQVHAVHVLVKVAENAPQAEVDAAKKKAEEAQKKIKGGEDFAAVAKQYSDDAMSKEKGGDLGFFRKGIMVPKFEEVAFALKPGEMTKEPVRTAFGFHVIKVLEHKPERVKPLEEVKDQIAESLKNRNMFKARRELVEKLKTEAKVEKLVQ